MWLYCTLGNSKPSFCPHECCWNSLFPLPSGFNRRVCAASHWDLLFSLLYIILKHLTAVYFTLHSFIHIRMQIAQQSLTINPIHSVAMMFFWLHSFSWNCVSLPMQQDVPVSANAVPPWTAIPSPLHQSERGSHPRAVANLIRQCYFSEIKPAAITAFSTGRPVAPTQDHSGGFQTRVLYL